MTVGSATAHGETLEPAASPLARSNSAQFRSAPGPAGCVARCVSHARLARPAAPDCEARGTRGPRSRRPLRAVGRSKAIASRASQQEHAMAARSVGAHRQGASTRRIARAEPRRTWAIASVARPTSRMSRSSTRRCSYCPSPTHSDATSSSAARARRSRRRIDPTPRLRARCRRALCRARSRSTAAGRRSAASSRRSLSHSSRRLARRLEGCAVRLTSRFSH